ncbi:hypothetical protein CLU79DRAFT_831065 [Phycomyces nitens]|nr:hypothetical protein CLU79DRAFT_831065 [Phycomyces nitens]
MKCSFGKTDSITFLTIGPNPVHLIGTCTAPITSKTIEDKPLAQSTEPPRVINYEDDYDMIMEAQECFEFRDTQDDRFLGGFELQHFELAPTYYGHDDINLREEERNDDDKKLNDRIALGLINGMLNSMDGRKIHRGHDLLKRLDKVSSQIWKARPLA